MERLEEEARRHEETRFAFSFRCGNKPPPPILDPRVRAAAALAEIGDARAVEPLTAAKTDKYDWVRTAAIAALERLKN